MYRHTEIPHGICVTSNFCHISLSSVSVSVEIVCRCCVVFFSYFQSSDFDSSFFSLAIHKNITSIWWKCTAWHVYWDIPTSYIVINCYPSNWFFLWTHIDSKNICYSNFSLCLFFQIMNFGFRESWKKKQV